jgi:hypothetical protein
MGPSGAVLADIDIAARQEVQFHHRLGGKFDAGKGIQRQGREFDMPLKKEMLIL